MVYGSIVVEFRYSFEKFVDEGSLAVPWSWSIGWPATA